MGLFRLVRSLIAPDVSEPLPEPVPQRKQPDRHRGRRVKLRLPNAQYEALHRIAKSSRRSLGALVNDVAAQIVQVDRGYVYIPSLSAAVSGSDVEPERVFQVWLRPSLLHAPNGAEGDEEYFPVGDNDEGSISADSGSRPPRPTLIGSDLSRIARRDSETVAHLLARVLRLYALAGSLDGVKFCSASFMFYSEKAELEARYCGRMESF